MALDEDVSAFIGRIYEAGTDDSAWRKVGEDLLKLTDCRFILLSVADFKNRTYSGYRYIGPETGRMLTGQTEFDEEFHKLDPSLVYSAAHPNGRFCDSRAAVASDDYLNDAYIKWNADRFGSTHWIVGYTPPVDDLVIGISLHPPAAQGALTEAQDRLFRLLFGHLERSLRLAARPPSLAYSRESIILLSRNGRVLAVSRRAEAMLISGDGLRLSHGFLVTSDARDQAELDRITASAADAFCDGTEGGSILLHRAHLGQPLVVTSIPLPLGQEPWTAGRPSILLKLNDLADQSTSLGSGADLFNLTPREKQVAEALLAGHSVESLAAVLDISRNTAKVHLHAIFHKTHTSRQSELVRLLASLCV